MVYNYSTGFDGEPELVFRTEGHEAIVALWEGYFGDIMDSIPPNGKGHWEGLTLIHHTCTGWYEVSPYKLSDLVQLNEQLKLQVNPGQFKFGETQAVYEALVALFEFSHTNDLPIVAEYY